MRDRYPGGKLKPIDNEQPWTRWRRIKDHAVRLGADPDIASVLGRLSLAGIITDKEAAAGIWAAEVIGRWERLEGLPRRTAASPAYERSYMRAMEWAGESLPQHERRVSRARRVHERLCRVLARESNPALARSILEDVCCNEIEVNSAHHGALARLLSTIARERGLT